MEKLKNTWGGRREGAGRPKSSPMVSHLKRPRVGKQRPIHIVLKVRSDAPDLRKPEILEVFEKATLRARRFGLRIIHFAFLAHSIEMICEFKKQEELEKSFKSLNTSLAIALKKFFEKQSGQKHTGPIFLGRFHMNILKTPEEVRLATRDLYLKASFEEKTEAKPDFFSSAALFGAWKDLLKEEYTSTFEDAAFDEAHKERLRHITAVPQFWLTQAGWREGAGAEPPPEFDESGGDDEMEEETYPPNVALVKKAEDAEHVEESVNGPSVQNHRSKLPKRDVELN
jgi:hypothetical protein